MTKPHLTIPFPVPDPLQTRLWSRVQKTKTCWLWTGNTVRGYGTVGWDYQSYLTHRLVWTMIHGPIPPGMCVLHHCDTRSCVNPDHLFLGTYLDNNRDMTQKGRHWQTAKTHCPHGHPYTPENTWSPPSGKGRWCRTCLRRHSTRWVKIISERRKAKRDHKNHSTS